MISWYQLGDLLASILGKFRLLTSEDIDALPATLTASQLFNKFWQMDLPDPPIFIYPSATPNYQYIAFADPADDEALFNEEYDNVKIVAIAHLSDDQSVRSIVWGADPTSIPEHPASDPFQEASKD
ncbi:hypothetical protein JIN82_00330 [Persicirhabdus sediminis]|uniref:Uncharacterized protein n=2 Tax=Persicirhabdus sediminis TaxID=454144 RepID=A0A8J7MAU8_9BACT|nr:hypothetical protein [Persicirhabdus sediminis]